MKLNQSTSSTFKCQLYLNLEITICTFSNAALLLVYITILVLEKTKSRKPVVTGGKVVVFLKSFSFYLINNIHYNRRYSLSKCNRHSYWALIVNEKLISIVAVPLLHILAQSWLCFKVLVLVLVSESVDTLYSFY